MPQTNKEKQALIKIRRANLGIYPRKMWLTDNELLQVKDHLAALRSKTPNKPR